VILNNNGAMTMASPSPATGNIFKAVTPQIVREQRAVDVES
jgi:hypothetical protein